MQTTTIRVDTETHAALLALAAESGMSLMATTKAATEALRRQRFAHHVTEELNALRADREAWADYLADAERTSVGDGVS
jgi:hypothetical protein